ncbi:hypothetical protein HPO_00360 [Hyphomonas polymorpha PS728]|uniref:PepSY domain-containing protein n=1 Tax=Hyphomonas polymorpha PS728 TaxID=1280954 RepID=A0A062VD24_9PROT|nr:MULTISPECIES: PepSY domain-containing protein [Hyphomonas]AXE63220.1 hypothetical protein BBF93_02570 [Hyphomonas sp. CACIAM 19H1]KDA00435.1 hypothetical protein HPO_00360 [Hyphomonas polymorpha PS728]
MSRLRILFAALLIASGSAAPAIAQRGGDDRSFAGFQVSRATAVDIARAQGVQEVLRVEARRGVWRVEGRSSEGQKMTVEVDGMTGAVVRVDRSGR